MKKILSEDQKIARAAYARQWRKNNPEKAAKHSKNNKLKNPEKVKARQKAWVEKNRERHTESAKQWYGANKDRVRDKQLQRTFGITLIQYNEMLISQNSQCAICGDGPDSKSKMFAVDHNHETGKIRSLLCRGCNVGIGNLKDSIDLLEKAAKYLKDHS